MAELARDMFISYLEEISGGGALLVSWVPVHRKTQQERGYNQGELLARRLVEQVRMLRPGLVLECACLARKVCITKAQKGLGRAARKENLRGAFVWEPSAFGELRPHEAVVLVDDVYTTGATVAEVAALLEVNAGLPVYVFTFSRAVSGGREGHD